MSLELLQQSSVVCHAEQGGSPCRRDGWSWVRNRSLRLPPVSTGEAHRHAAGGCVGKVHAVARRELVTEASWTPGPTKNSIVPSRLDIILTTPPARPALSKPTVTHPYEGSDHGHDPGRHCIYTLELGAFTVARRKPARAAGMSRGGRGGFRGGRGGGGGGAAFGKGRMGGVELPWDYDPDLKIESKPSELFPVSEEASEQLREAEPATPLPASVAHHAQPQQGKRATNRRAKISRP